MKSILIFLLLSLPIFSIGQVTSDSILPSDNNRIPLPTIDVNVGISHGFTDVALSSDGPTPFRQLGYQLTINQQVGKFLNVGFQLYTGSLLGEEQRGNVNLNFRTSLVSPRLGVEYNFYPLIKPRPDGRQLVRPYVGFGLGGIFFRSKADLRNENNVLYNYWSNGNIYAEPEGSVSESQATALTRDFEYETDLRDENIDGLRKYSQTAFSLPFHAGVRFQFSKNVGINLAFSYVMNFTDLLDNVNSESIGVRQGNSNFDNHLFGSLGLSVYLGSTSPSTKPKVVVTPVLAESDLNPADSTSLIKPKQETDDWDKLAIISRELISATQTIEKTAVNSNESLEESSNRLNSIADREIASKKDLKSVKKESYEILSNSITVLSSTNNELNNAKGKISVVTEEIKQSGLQEQLNQSEKIRVTIDNAIPAIESLMAKIKNAKTPEELQSILSITSNNLTHTKDIFTQESESLTESISDARKIVAVARTEKLLLQEINSRTEIAALESELEELKNDGKLSEAEYNRLQRSIKESKAQLELTKNNETNSDLESNDGKKNQASQLLKNALVTIRTTNSETSERLYENRIALNSLAEKELSSKKQLSLAKKEALAIVEQALANLNSANNSVNEVSNDVKAANSSLNSSNTQLTTKLEQTISKTQDLLEASKSKIQTSKNAEELKSIISIASTNIDKTRNTISSETSNLTAKISKARKDLVLNGISELAVRTNDSNLSNPGNPSTKAIAELNNQLFQLQADKLISETDLRELQEKLTKASEASKDESPSTISTNSEDEVTDTTFTNQVVSIADSKSNETAETPSVGNKTTGNEPFDLQSIEDSSPKETGNFLWADLNNDNWISPSEVLHFIDLLFEVEPVRSVQDIQNLIDYYFDQE